MLADPTTPDDPITSEDEAIYIRIKFASCIVTTPFSSF
jgi:hypothetical protein